MNIYDLMLSLESPSWEDAYTSILHSPPENFMEQFEEAVLAQTLHLSPFYTTLILMDLRTIFHDFYPANMGVFITAKTLSLNISSDKENAVHPSPIYQFNVGAASLKKDGTIYHLHIYDDYQEGREIHLYAGNMFFFFLEAADLPDITSYEPGEYKQSSPHLFSEIKTIQALIKF